ncbi:lipin 3 [Loa loa]|uniref:Lipin 3 n=1 Tax=Loa loa TaxID=7209 RepID=A0A1I7VDP7_LOALO|nr:lipin 3 [Loa loa]EFO19745.1 lipin 3 [Loa loa]
MNYAYRLLDNVKYFYKTLNPASLSGAIDLIVVEQPDGSYLSTPFHVRFGKYGVLNSDEKYVDITVNGEEIDLKMKLGENGVAFFTEPTTDADVPEYLVTSPVPGSSSTPVDGKDLANRIEKIRRELSRSRYKRALSECSSSRSHSSHSREHSCELDIHLRKTLPFNASLFSQRRNRSLPNLTDLTDDQLQKNSKRITKNKRQLMDSHSFAAGRSLSPPTCTFRRNHAKASTEIMRKLSNSTNEESDVDDAASIVSIDSGTDRLKVPGLGMISDGAFSDSELDRHRDTLEPHKNEVMVWKWGELPRTLEETEKAKKKQGDMKTEQEKKGSTWGGWFCWSRAKPTEDQGVYLDDLVQSASDPSKIEKYLGMSPPTACPSPPSDSGNGSITGLNSPPKDSDNEDEANSEVQQQGRTSTPTSDSKKHAININLSGNQLSLRSSDTHEPTEAHGCETKRNLARSITPSSDIFPMSDEEAESAVPALSGAETTIEFPKYIRSLRLSSDKLKKLGLRKGANEARFSITTKFQGTTWCSCHIYLYKWTERLVISDIDGTITKSDVLGHVIPAIGGQWAHAGVAELYTRIKENGYQLVYLSSRAIGQSYSTKKYLQSVAQNAKFLPDGPLLLSPTSVLMAFRREVIDRKPEEFKIAALTDLKECFPVKRPFYAGFGNRETDVVSYRAVDIPPDRILIIDKQGRVRRADSIGFETSFMSLAMDIVDYMFPPLIRRRNERQRLSEPKKNSFLLAPSFYKAHSYSDFTHWQSKAGCAVRLDDNTLESYEAKRKSFHGKYKKK